MLARTEIGVALWRSAAARSSRAPWSPLHKPAPKRLTAERRRELVATVADIFSRAGPTAFALEGTVRHGLRSALCLKGWSWAGADQEAAAIVSRALSRNGAKRPSWLQGQRDWVDTAPSTRTTWDFTYCARCRKPLPEDDANRFYRRFCSRLCSAAAQSEKYQRDHKAEIAARRLAHRVANPELYRERQRAYMARQPERQCQNCGKLYQPRRLKQKFCCRACRPAPPGRWGKRVAL